MTDDSRQQNPTERIEIPPDHQSQTQCEIRVPTFKRPTWLGEALHSLMEQSHPNWRVVILDDDPERSAECVVQSMSDARFHYVPTTGGKGAAENLARAFRKTPFFNDSVYFCVLEDDNWLMPAYLDQSIRLIKEKQVNLLHVNQECWWRPANGKPTSFESSTLETVLPQGLLTAEHLHAGVFFFQGISNGSLFWSINLASDLSAPVHTSRDAYVQEMQRCLAIQETSFCSHQCLSIWTDSEKENKHRIFEASKATHAQISMLKRQVFRDLKAKKMLHLIDEAFHFHTERRYINVQLWRKELVHAAGSDLANTPYCWLLFRYPKQFAGHLIRQLRRRFDQAKVNLLR